MFCVFAPSKARFCTFASAGLTKVSKSDILFGQGKGQINMCLSYEEVIRVLESSRVREIDNCKPSLTEDERKKRLGAWRAKKTLARIEAVSFFFKKYGWERVLAIKVRTEFQPVLFDDKKPRWVKGPPEIIFDGCARLGLKPEIKIGKKCFGIVINL